MKLSIVDIFWYPEHFLGYINKSGLEAEKVKLLLG